NQPLADGPAEASPIEEVPKPSEREFRLLRHLLSVDEEVGIIADHVQLDWIEHQLVQAIISKRLEAHRNGTWRGVPGLLQQFESPATQQLITAAASGRVLERRATG